MESSGLHFCMPEAENTSTDIAPQAVPQTNEGFEAFERGGQRQTLRQVLSKPVTIVAIVLGLAIMVFVVFLQQDPSALTLEIPELRYELLPNDGLSEGVPIAIRMGHLMVFQISDPVAGGGGATRAKQIITNLTLALNQLVENPPRVITIETGVDADSPVIVQKEYTDSDLSLQIVQVTAGDLALAKTDDAKLLARLWAERLTDSLRLLLFGEPPEFSRDTLFGSALDTLYVNAMSAEGSLTTDALNTAFEGLPVDLQRALTEAPSLPLPGSGPPNELQGAAAESGS